MMERVYEAVNLYALDHDYIPKDILYRDAVIKRILRILRVVPEACIVVVGNPSTGKTFVANVLKRSLKGSSVVYYRLTPIDRCFNVVSTIVETIANTKVGNRIVSIERLGKRLEGKRFTLILDNFEISKCGTQVVHAIETFREKFNISCNVVILSREFVRDVNSLKCFYLEEYTREQRKEILIQRLREANILEFVPSDVLEYLSKLDLKTSINLIRSFLINKGDLRMLQELLNFLGNDDFDEMVKWKKEFLSYLRKKGGSVPFSAPYKELYEALGWNYKEYKKFVQHLRSKRFIDVRSKGKRKIIKILNY